ncbi:MAG: formyltransferase family protein [Geobacteraceae bacterium]|nr:formyltransferase family protein [Geobacteraceae bacterium]
MNIAVLCHGTVLQPTLEALYSQGLLAGVAVPDSAGGDDVNLPLEMALRQAGIPFLRVGTDDLAGQLAPWLGQIAADVVCCMGFPGKIPPELLELPRLGFFNLHGGALPRYRGPDPVFWQIKNREPFGAITIHRMTPKIDGGGIAHTERVALGPDDTYALHMQRLGGTLPRVMIEFVQQLAIQGDKLPLHAQETTTTPYLPRPADADRTIDWTRSAVEVDALVRACNPVYGGALSLLKGIPVRLLEVAAAPPCADSQTPAGTIIAASATDGIRIVCGQGESLSLELFYAADGFFTGRRLARIFGLRPGDRMA